MTVSEKHCCAVKIVAVCYRLLCIDVLNVLILLKLFSAWQTCSQHGRTDADGLHYCSRPFIRDALPIWPRTRITLIGFLDKQLHDEEGWW